MADNYDYDVIIVGGGAIGCSIAYKLAPEVDVLLLERGQIAGETTGRSLAHIVPTQVFSEKPKVVNHIQEFFREIDGTGHFRFIDETGLATVLPEEEEVKRERVKNLQKKGYNVTYHDQETIQNEFPSYDFSSFSGAIEYEDFGRVDPHTYAFTLKELAEEQGASFKTNTEVTDLLVENNEIEGVQTQKNTFTAPDVVVGAGWWTTEIIGDHASIPIRPSRLQILVLESPIDLDSRPPRVWAQFDDKDLSFRFDRDDQLLVFGGEWDIEGFDGDPEGLSGSYPDDKFLNEVIEGVPQIMPGFEEAGVSNGYVCVDSATPDTWPIVDTDVGDIDGLTIASGMCGLGIMFSSVVPEVVHSLILGSECKFPVSDFSLDRFSSMDSDFKIKRTVDVAKEN